MRLIHCLCNPKKELKLLKFRLKNRKKDNFVCPVCRYTGPFMDHNRPAGYRKHANCPNCFAKERHRLQYLVVQHVLEDFKTSEMTMLHFAPEKFFRSFFSERFGKYETADLNRRDVDHKVDIQNLPFADSSYSFIFASHVLEHIPDDIKAIKEIRRILKPNGVAMLSVPLVAEKTIEYPEPNPQEHNHIRAPGCLDYYDRFTPFFSKIEKYTSESFPEKYQLFVYEDRSKWPNDDCPLRLAMEGEKHIDIVPVCYA